MIFTEKELRQLIEFHVREKLGINEDRTLLRLPNTGGEQYPPMDDANMQPTEDMEQPPMDDEMSDDVQPDNMPPTIDDPNIAELVDLLQANPDRAEGVLKYAKGIIGNDNVPSQDVNQQQSQDSNLPENRTFDLDEMISDIIMGNNQKTKPTITRPIGTMNTMKGKMFRPIMGNG